MCWSICTQAGCLPLIAKTTNRQKCCRHTLRQHFFYIFIFPCFCRDGLPVRFHRSFMLLLSVTLGKVGILSSLQRDLKIGGKLVLNLIFFTASVISILHDSPSVSVCFLANRTIYGGFLHRLGLKKRKKSQPVSSLHKKPAANENDNSETLCVMDKTRKLSNAQQGCFLSFTGVCLSPYFIVSNVLRST